MTVLVFVWFVGSLIGFIASDTWMGLRGIDFYAKVAVGVTWPIWVPPMLILWISSSLLRK